MQEELKERLSSKDIWGRALYMILFAIAYSIAEFVITFLVIFQFVAILFTGHANEPLLKLGKSLGSYIKQLLKFQTFNTETKPFPFSSWPEEETGENRWLENASTGSESSVAETVSEERVQRESPAETEAKLSDESGDASQGDSEGESAGDSQPVPDPDDERPSNS